MVSIGVIEQLGLTNLSHILSYIPSQDMLTYMYGPLILTYSRGSLFFYLIRSTQMTESTLVRAHTSVCVYVYTCCVSLWR